jgi:exosome complex component CSL4
MEREKGYPGKEIGVMEEYLADRGTYIDWNGIIRSKYLGFIFKDNEMRKVFVKPFRKLKILEVGDTVLGRIINVSGVFGYVRIEAVNLKPLDRDFNGIVYPHRIVNRIDDVYREGDYILAKVISKVNRSLHLSIAEPDLGVVSAKCSYCGGRMRPIGKNKLRCMRCSNIEMRKLSRLYGRVI